MSRKKNGLSCLSGRCVVSKVGVGKGKVCRMTKQILPVIFMVGAVGDKGYIGIKGNQFALGQ